MFFFFVFCITTCTARSTTMNHDQLRSTTIHYDPVRSCTIHYDPFLDCLYSLDPHSFPTRSNSIPQVEGTTDPSTVSCVDDDINNEGKGVHVSVLANSTHADPPSLVLFLCCVLCFSLSPSPSFCCRFKSWHHVARSKLQSGTFVRHTGHDRTGSTCPSRRRGCGHRQWSRRYVKCVIMIHVGGTGIVSLPVQDENTDSDHLGWCIDSNM